MRIEGRAEIGEGQLRRGRDLNVKPESRLCALVEEHSILFVRFTNEPSPSLMDSSVKVLIKMINPHLIF